MQTFDPLAEPTGHRRSQWLRNLHWLYLAAVCLMLAAIRLGGDRVGWATILAYGPRDVALVPGVLLLLIEGVRRRLSAVVVLALLIAAGPMMNANVPWKQLLAGPVSGPVIHVLELNADGHGTGGRKYDLARIQSLLRDTGRDVATFEEWTVDQPPPLTGPGWFSARHEELLFLSRWPILETRKYSSIVNRNFFAMGCRLDLPGGRSPWVFIVHLQTPRHGFEPLLRRMPGAYAELQKCLRDRDNESATVNAWIADQAGSDRANAIVGGDFNLAGDGVVFRRRWGNWTDGFTAAGWGWGQTKLQTGWRVRIDHILSGSALSPQHCWVGPDVSSDHLPVLADIAMR